MSDYVWQPVENQEDAIAAAMQHILRWDKLPADAALCRRVPAPAQGVPVEAIRTLREYGIPLGMTYAKWHKACQEVQRWLDAQPQTGQEVE